MFLGLWHPTVVRCNHEKREINRTHACDHVFDEVFVAGNIHNPDVKSG